jgi:uncharacterized membrane protein YeiB
MKSDLIFAYLVFGLIWVELVRTKTTTPLAVGGVLALVFFWPLVLILAGVQRARA